MTIILWRFKTSFISINLFDSKVPVFHFFFVGVNTLLNSRIIKPVSFVLFNLWIYYCIFLALFISHKKQYFVCN